MDTQCAYINVILPRKSNTNQSTAAKSAGREHHSCRGRHEHRLPFEFESTTIEGMETQRMTFGVTQHEQLGLRKRVHAGNSIFLHQSSPGDTLSGRPPGGGSANRGYVALLTSLKALRRLPSTRDKASPHAINQSVGIARSWAFVHSCATHTFSLSSTQLSTSHHPWRRARQSLGHGIRRPPASAFQSPL